MESSETHFASLVRLPCMCGTMRRAARAVSRLYEEEFRRAGLSRTGLRGPQYTFLRTLQEMRQGHSDGVPQGALAEVVGMDQTTLTRNIQPLVRRKWVAIRPGEQDRRERFIRLTQAGQAIVEKGFSPWQAAQRRLQESVGPADWKTLGDVLAIVTEAAMRA